MQRFTLFAVAFSLLSQAADVGAQPAKTFPQHILLIRHAEKLPPPQNIDVHLSYAGKKRADNLHRLFIKSDDRPEPFPKPHFLFAAHNTDKSHRPLETVAPLGVALKLPVNSDFRNSIEPVSKKDVPANDINGLRDEIFVNEKYAGKTVLICWRHGTMPELARALKAAKAPVNWRSEVFDRVWQIDFDDKGNATFKDRPQRLLPGDSKK